MEEFILKYWLQVIFGIVMTVLGAFSKIIYGKVKQNALENEALKEGVIALLHDRLFQSCMYYIGQGYVPLRDAERVKDNVKIIYDTYHSLGGNGTGTDIYDKFRELPLKEVEK